MDASSNLGAMNCPASLNDSRPQFHPRRRSVLTRRVFFFLFLVIATTGASAQPWTWKVDRAHTKVLFSVTHMVIADVTGRFKEFEIALTQTKDDFTDAELTAAIKVNSIDTDNERRDTHLRSADFFDAANYPEITFKSKSFEKVDDDKYRVEGDLNIRGVTKTVVFDVKFNGQIKDPSGKMRAGFKATTSIKRYDFGVSWNRALDAGGWLVSDKVEITVNAEMVMDKQT
jgi:polyisoprenoid-binding protein YceI